MSLTAAVLALALAITATGALVAPTAAGAKPKGTTTTSTTAPPTTAPPLPAFDRTLNWTDCGDGFQCATLTVPVDWSQPTGETMGLALTRLPAADPAQRIGSLVVNYGGPGEGGVDYLHQTYGRLPPEIRNRFDVVSFDPRGTGASRPIDCVDDAALDESMNLPTFFDTEAALQAQQQWNATYAQGCTQRMGAYAGQVGTRNVARDLEAIRLALGDPQLTYLGYSYGTILGQAYAQMYPKTVRAMVLDGPPDYSLSIRDYNYQQAKGFADALNAFLAWCEQTQCSLASVGNPRDVLNGLVERTKTETIPADYTANGVTRNGVLNGNSLQTGVLSLLYDQQRGWPLLADALRSAAANNWGGPLLAYSDSYLGRDPNGRYTSTIVEANSVINCVDRPAAKVQPTQRAGARRHRGVPAAAPAVGWLVGAAPVRRDAQAREGRQARQAAGERHRTDPGDRQHRRPGHALRGRAGHRRPRRRLHAAHRRLHRAHRLRQRPQRLRRRPRRPLPRRRHPARAGHPLRHRIRLTTVPALLRAARRASKSAGTVREGW